MSNASTRKIGSGFLNHTWKNAVKWWIDTLQVVYVCDGLEYLLAGNRGIHWSKLWSAASWTTTILYFWSKLYMIAFTFIFLEWWWRVDATDWAMLTLMFLNMRKHICSFYSWALSAHLGYGIDTLNFLNHENSPPGHYTVYLKLGVL